MSEIFFSVIIPLYNKADVIGRSLRSVAAQTFRDFELIVVDDGSTDNSVIEVERFRNSEEWRDGGRELQIIRQENAGASAARNRGATAARGRFVTMLDGDDEWLPNHLADIRAVFVAYPEARVMTTNSVSVNNGIPEWPEHKRSGIGTFNVFDFPDGSYPISSDTITVDRQLFLAIGGYDTRYSYYEDREFYYRLGDAVGDFYVNWTVSAYYHHDAVCSAHVGRRRGYGEYGFLCLAESRLQSGTISLRMKKCAIGTMNIILRGNVVRFNFNAVLEMYQAFPLLSQEIFFVRWYVRSGSHAIVWCAYLVEWLWAVTSKLLRGLCHA